MKQPKFRVILNDKNIDFDNSKDCIQFLGIKSYSIFYQIVKGNTKFKHIGNKHLENIHVERINVNLTKQNKKIRNDVLNEQKEKYLKSLKQMMENIIINETII